jgi:hypothetical protein
LDGIKGQTCKSLTKNIQDALGTTTDEVEKQEMYEVNETENEQNLGVDW